MVLNEAAIKSAKPGAIIWDDSLKGFGLRAGKTSKTFVVLIASGRRKKLGRYPLLSLAQARDAARKLLAEKQLGKVLPKHTAFEDARNEFLEDCGARLRPATVTQYAWNLGHFPWTRQSLAEVSRRDIEAVLKKQKPSVKEHLDRIGRTFFSWCVRKEFIDRSPMEKMDKPPQGKSRSRVLTGEELKKVYKAACELQNGTQQLAYLLIRTGQRPGELRRLKRAYIAADRITLPGEVTKNGREHVFPISRETHKAIASFPQIDGSDYVFPASRTHVRGIPVEYMTIGTKAWRAFQKECGVSNFTRHDLRRTLSTMWAEKLQIPPHLIERMLNHVSGQVSGVAAIYNRASYLEELRRCIQKWERYLATLAA